MGSIISINISKEKGVSKQKIDEGELIENFGLKDDAHGGNWHRQVSFLAIESIEKMNKVENIQLKPGDLAENFTTEGIDLLSIKVGTKFSIGDTILELTQIGKQCHDGCEIFHKVGSCIMPKEGVFAKVIKGGNIKSGNEIAIVSDI